MKNVIIILLLFSFTSCMTTKRIKRHCPEFLQICVVEKEIVKEIIYRDTTIYKIDTIRVPLPVHDTVRLVDTVTVREDGLVYLPTVHKEFGLIGVDASVHRSILKIYAYLTDSTILYIEPDTIKLEKAIKVEITKETNYVKVVLNGYKWALGICVFLLAIGIGGFIYKIKRT